MYACESTICDLFLQNPSKFEKRSWQISTSFKYIISRASISDDTIGKISRRQTLIVYRINMLDIVLMKLAATYRAAWQVTGPTNVLAMIFCSIFLVIGNYFLIKLYAFTSVGDTKEAPISSDATRWEGCIDRRDERSKQEYRIPKQGMLLCKLSITL